MDNFLFKNQTFRLASQAWILVTNVVLKIIQPIGLIKKMMMKNIKFIDLEQLVQIKTFISWCKATSLEWFLITVSILTIPQLSTSILKLAPQEKLFMMIFLTTTPKDSNLF